MLGMSWSLNGGLHCAKLEEGSRTGLGQPLTAGTQQCVRFIHELRTQESLTATVFSLVLLPLDALSPSFSRATTRPSSTEVLFMIFANISESSHVTKARMHLTCR